MGKIHPPLALSLKKNFVVLRVFFVDLRVILFHEVTQRTTKKTRRTTERIFVNNSG
jgi:hypothetical protein